MIKKQFGGIKLKDIMVGKNGKNINMSLYNFDEKDILTTAIEQSSVAILLTDIKANIIYVNPAFEKISGYSAEELIGENPRILKSELTPPETYKKMWETISNGGIWNGEQINKRKDGSLYYEDLTITPIYDKANKIKYYLGIKHDITERKELEKKLEEIAIRDPLTNAYNRRYLMDRLRQMESNYKRLGRVFSLGILDIDSFKNVNDLYGHQGGDYILVQLVKLLNNSIRSYDILSRYGGEEFIIVFPDTDKYRAYKTVKRILSIVRNKDFIYQGKKINITFSGGISDANEISFNDFNIEELIKLADQRLYKGKNNGKNQIIK